MTMNNYQIYDEIGKGKFSKVYKGRRKKTAQYYAILSIEKSQRERVITSVKFLRHTQHRRVIKFYDWYETNNHFWVITELCTGGDMRRVLSLNGRLSEAAVRMFAADIAEGLMHIHSCGVIYGNLKPSNILMDSTTSMRFYDFSLSCDISAACGEGTVGTPLYMAPELFTKEGVPSMASDLWAFGCVVYEMCTGKPPFNGTDLASLITNVMTKEFSSHEELPNSLGSLLSSLLIKDPLRRATWSDVVSHGYWQGKLKLPGVPFPPQLNLENMKKAASAGGGGGWPISPTDLKRHVEWAVENAKRNFAVTQLVSEGEPLTCPAVTDEVDFRDHNRAGDTATDAGQEESQNALFSLLNHFATPTTSTATATTTAARHDFCQVKEQLSMTDKGVEAKSNKNKNADSCDYSDKSDRIAKPVLLVTGDKLEHLDLEGVLMHVSDAHIRPLVMNSRIERFVEQKYDSTALKFEPPTKTELKAYDSQRQAHFITMIYQIFSSSLGFEEKYNVMCYFESVCTDASIANFIVNSSVMMLCLKMASQQKAPTSYRATAASIMGILVRYATFIHTDLAKANVLSSIVSVCSGESSSRVRRKLAACLGELLVYIAVQRESERAVWEIDAQSIFNLYIALLTDADDVLKHYAVKAIESLASVTDRGIALEIFAKPEIIKALLDIYLLLPSSTRSEHMRASAVSAALKLAIIREELMLLLLDSEKFGVEFYVTVFTTSTQQRTAQALLTFINMALVKGLVAVQNEIAITWGKRAKSVFSNSSLTREQGTTILKTIQQIVRAVLNDLLRAVENSSVAMKGKTLVLFVLIGCMDERLLLTFCTNRNIGYIDSIMKEKDLYVKHCASCFVTYFNVFIDVHLAAVASDALSECSLSNILNALCIVMDSRNLGMMIELSDNVFASLGVCLRKTMTSPRYATFESEFSKFVGIITQSCERILNYRRAIVHNLLPAYVHMLGGNNVERHFSALRLLTAFILPLVDNSSVTREERALETEKLNHLMKTVAGFLSGLLEENEPIPIHAMRLLTTCAERGLKGFAEIATLELATRLVTYMMQPKQIDFSVPLRLLLLIAQQTKQTNAVMSYLSSQEFFTIVIFKTLTMAVAEGVDQLLESCCEFAAFFLKHAVETADTLMRQQCLFLSPQRGIETLWLPLCLSRVRTVAQHASACVNYLVQLSPEAKNGILSAGGVNILREIISETRENPIKISNILCALRYACEQASKKDLERVSQALLAVLDAIAREGECNKELSLDALRIIALFRQ